MLKKFDCFDVVPVRTFYDPSIHLKRNKESSIYQIEYAKIIGSAMFLLNYTRADIAYDVSRLSRYTHNPNSEHWNALHRLLKYLRGICDANLVTDNDEVSSTSVYVFTLGAGAISWKSSKQTCITRSTMNSEFIVLEFAGKKLNG
ncbi:secreted RxLR effector protein 161-like [Solanum lycopersicum]|uniref:secreted RxLR effector protein 161-like n=1 Tax=Solanum lycopersicum TaxID=4081 RepID=UPI00374A0D11